MAGKLSVERQAAFEDESARQIIDYVKKHAGSDKPFFIYWATYTQQITGAEAYHDSPHVDRANAQASMMMQHNVHIRRLLDTLRGEGIDENTLVVRMMVR